MDKPSTYLLITYFPTYLAISETYFLTELVNKAKPNTIAVEVHPQLSNNRHPVDGALVGPGSVWPIYVPINPYHMLCPNKLYFEFCCRHGPETIAS
jgi:hypothetical protein